MHFSSDCYCTSFACRLKQRLGHETEQTKTQLKMIFVCSSRKTMHKQKPWGSWSCFILTSFIMYDVFNDCMYASCTKTHTSCSLFRNFSSQVAREWRWNEEYVAHLYRGQAHIPTYAVLHSNVWYGLEQVLNANIRLISRTQTCKFQFYFSRKSKEWLRVIITSDIILYAISVWLPASLPLPPPVSAEVLRGSWNSEKEGN